MKQKIIYWLKKETVLIIAGVAAILSMLFVPPSSLYLEYIDYRVLALLFCLMAVVTGLQKNGVFIILSRKMLKGVKTIRGLCYVLVLLCFFSSMWITNDVALITFVPFAILILQSVNQSKYSIYVIVMQTVAANLGSMLTPVGNPQNLYLYTYYKVGGTEFLWITLPITVGAFLLISVISFFIKADNIYVPYEQEGNMTTDPSKIQKKYSTISYFILFILCLGTVLHFIDYRITLILVILFILFLDKSIFRNIDYSLLLTFVCFFIFIGNLGSMETIRTFISKSISNRELLSTVLISQFISNVPAAVLLSNFTTEYKSLIVGTNLGGLGTLIASLASLISYKFYCKTENAKPVRYLLRFSEVNIGMLVILYLFYDVGLK